MAQARTVTVGQVKKCPSCGQPIESFQGRCPGCGHELSAGEVANSFKEFVKKWEKLEREDADKEVMVAAIDTFPIPNNREDLLEFSIYVRARLNDFILNATHVSDSGGGYDPSTPTKKNKITYAWVNKMEQLYLKAQVVLVNDQASLSSITSFYNDIKQARKTNKTAIKKYKIIIGIIIAAIIVIFLVL